MVFDGKVTPSQARELLLEAIRGAFLMVDRTETRDITEPLMSGDAERISVILRGCGGIACWGTRQHVEHLVFHWPTVFKEGLLHPHNVQTRLVWLFQGLIRRRSPLLFSLLRRKLIEENAIFEESGKEVPVKEYKDVIPLSVSEVFLYEQLVEQFCGIPELGANAKSAFNRMYNSMELASPISSRELAPMWKKLHPENSPVVFQTTSISRLRLVDIRDTLMCGREFVPPDTRVNAPGYSSSQWGGEMFDVLSLVHLIEDRGEFGVYRYTDMDTKIRYVLINIPLYLKQLSREDKFSGAGRRYAVREPIDPDSLFRNELLLRWSIQFPLLLNMPKEKFPFGQVWPGIEIEDALVVPIPKIEEYRARSRKMERIYITKISAWGTDDLAKKIETKRAAKFRAVQLWSPPIREAEGYQFSIRAVHKNGEVYFSPEWEADSDPAMLLGRNYRMLGDESLLCDGVILNSGTGEYYYTLAQYFKFEETPVREYAELKQWLQDYLKGLTKLEFNNILTSLKRCPTPDGFVPYDAAKIPAKRSKMFNAVEDNIIIRLLRPGNFSEVMVRLEEIDPTKTRGDVTLRARQLRERLIAEGIYELDKLPRSIYNSALGRRLNKLRKVKEAKEVEEAEKLAAESGISK